MHFNEKKILFYLIATALDLQWVSDIIVKMKFHLYFARKKKSCKEQTNASQMEVVSETIHFGIVYGTKRLNFNDFDCDLKQ
jgi:hypothetical protein